MRWLVYAIVAVIGAACGASAHAWGPSGHRTVCEIAFQNLTPTARAEVLRLLQTHPVIPVAQPLNKEFAWACTYPDRTVEGGPTRRDPEHFVNYPRNSQLVTVESGCGTADVCVPNAIVADLALLRSTAVADRHRAVALMFLGHWVGDIHQPLHVSFADDRGGGKINTSGLCSDSLHSAWDSCILQRRIFATTQDPSIAAIQNVAGQWSAALTVAERTEWLSSFPWQWAQESYAIATRPEIKYCVMVQTTCRYSATQEAFAGGSPRTVPIDDAYAAMAAPIIQRRITQAGIRLAHLINLALDPAYRTW